MCANPVLSTCILLKICSKVHVVGNVLEQIPKRDRLEIVESTKESPSFGPRPYWGCYVEISGTIIYKDLSEEPFEHEWMMITKDLWAGESIICLRGVTDS